MTAPGGRWFYEQFADAVWESDLPQDAKVVALAYARHAVDERQQRSATANLCDMSYPRLMRLSGIRKRANIPKAYALLEESGWFVAALRAPRRSTVYRLTIPAAAVATPAPDVVDVPATEGQPEQTAAQVPEQRQTRGPKRIGSSGVGTTEFPWQRAASSDAGTTVVPPDTPGGSDVGTTVVPTSELRSSPGSSKSSSERVSKTLRSVATRLDIDDDDARAVINKIKKAARGPIGTLGAYLNRICDDDLYEHLDELRQARLLPSQRTAANVLQFRRTPAPPGQEQDLTDWQTLQANEDARRADPEYAKRHAAAAAAARAAAPTPQRKFEVAPS